MHRHRSWRAFSIVELMVVIGIIAILIAILMPTLGRTRELSRRTVCASNLRNVGLAAHAFANNHEGKFPVAFSTPAAAAADGKRMPMAVSLDDALMAGDAPWKRLGIPMSEWEKHGAPEAIWKCPSSRFDFRRYNVADGVPAPNWGPLLWTDYMYIGGLIDSSAVLGKSKGRWGLLMPAVTLVDRYASERILAADAAFLAGTSAWGRQIHINHPMECVAQRVAYQAVLYADGHVASTLYDKFPLRLDQEKSRYSLLYDNKNSTGGYFFWGPGGSYTPGKAVPPQTPPKAPAPTPPSTPTPPKPPAPPPPPPPPSTTDPLP